MIVNAETVFEAGASKGRGFPALNLGICWDFGHAALAGIDQQQAMEAVAPWLHALHVNDNNGKDERHYPTYLYRGGIDWKGVMQELKAIHYNDDFNFEVRFPARGLPDNFSN